MTDDLKESIDHVNSEIVELNKISSDASDQVSDTYHTFGELYNHRTGLFAAICNICSDDAWKSKHHEDGSMYDGMFIAGIKTDAGQATYHIENRYWDSFMVKELPNAPHFDGHTPTDALQRIVTHSVYYRLRHLN